MVKLKEFSQQKCVGSQVASRGQFKSFVGRTYLHEFVALEGGSSVKQELAVLNVVFESRHVNVTEWHELLKEKVKLSISRA